MWDVLGEDLWMQSYDLPVPNPFHNDSSAKLFLEYVAMNGAGYAEARILRFTILTRWVAWGYKVASIRQGTGDVFG